MNLSKIELQEMLREMGLKFSHDTSYEELLRMFQSENHRRWLGEHRPDGPKRVIRRRRLTAPASSDTPLEATFATKPIPRKEATPARDNSNGTLRKTKSRPRRDLPARRFKRDNDAPVVLDRRQNVFATVLRRAKRCCELCETAPPEEPAASGGAVEEFLSPYYLVPLDEGGQEVVKNVVALCPDCRRKLSSQPRPADLKTLKRKAREKVIASVVVVRR
jgi:5-methylcytosine-specific restriction enzyme A